MKELIDSGTIGEVRNIWCRHFVSYGGDSYFKDWHAERRYSTSLLLQKGAHDIDVIHWLAGAYTQRVTAFGSLTVYNQCQRRGADEPWDRAWIADHWPPLSQTGINPQLDVEDHSMVLMNMENKCQACYLQCHYTPDACRNYTVIGTEGRIENLGDRADTAVIAVWSKRESDRIYRLTGQTHHTIQAEQGSHDGADPAMVDDFLKCIRGEAGPTVPAVAARNAVAVGCLGAESLRSGGTPRDIPPVMAAAT
jgi:predicted dehydrogenase